ncbi:glycosyltransferase [Adlercreutzia muris]|uniref:glycosyltransferase n=1 Tax=Adlercreutzia muris TaxID=1796610 RepID=UPI001F59EB6E|nr:glycosyltransferase [Adlercreutzia muris]
MAKVCHVSSAHDSHDIRIFVKECRTLAAEGHQVSFVVYGDDEEVDGVSIVGLGERSASRRTRMTQGAKKAYEKAASLAADIYHLHDPELLPYAKKLKRQGARVVFDSHEDVPVQIMSKTWIPRMLRRLISSLYDRFETGVVRDIDAVVCATPYIGEKFEGRAKLVGVVNNYPMLSDVELQDSPFNGRPANVCYTGGISEVRGSKVMAEAAAGIHGSLLLAGKQTGSAVEWGSNCFYLGMLDREGVNRVYAESVAGLVLLLPLENYLVSRPIKMFEYMAAGLPVVASDFPEWRKVIDRFKCGVCVDPDDGNAVCDAINYLLENREEAQAMGRRGRLAVESEFSWDSEAAVLVSLYESLLAE